MVVLHHDELHRTLWGDATTTGRSVRLDAAVYMQLMLLLALAATCAVEFDKPVAVRLSVAAVSTLLYFRNTALFVKLALFVSLVVLYGDVALPIALFLRAKAAVSSVQTVRLALTCVWLGKNVMILFALFRSGAFRSRSLKTLRRPMMRRKMPAKAE